MVFLRPFRAQRPLSVGMVLLLGFSLVRRKGDGGESWAGPNSLKMLMFETVLASSRGLFYTPVRWTTVPVSQRHAHAFEHLGSLFRRKRCVTVSISGPGRCDPLENLREEGGGGRGRGGGEKLVFGDLISHSRETQNQKVGIDQLSWKDTEKHRSWKVMIFCTCSAFFCTCSTGTATRPCVDGKQHCHCLLTSLLQ